jgi:NADH-quinone oxidoreductase subunit G
MCDHGRINTFKSINAEDRVDGPRVRRDGSLQEVTWDDAFSEVSKGLKSFNKNEVAFIGSGFATLEDNYLLYKFAGSVFGSKNIDFMRHINPEFGDDILRKDDVTPNSTGAEAVFTKKGQNTADFESIIKGIKENKIKALYILEDDIVSADPSFEEVLTKLDLLIVHASNFNKTTAIADIVFPAATYAEKNGTMVNFKGRVQRIKPAVSTVEMDRAMDGMSMSRLDKFGSKYDRWAQGHKYDALSSWKIISRLAETMGTKMKFNLAEDVFTEISKTIPAFSGLDYDDIGELGVQSKLQPNENTVSA